MSRAELTRQLVVKVLTDPRILDKHIFIDKLLSISDKPFKDKFLTSITPTSTAGEISYNFSVYVLTKDVIDYVIKEFYPERYRLNILNAISAKMDMIEELKKDIELLRQKLK